MYSPSRLSATIQTIASLAGCIIGAHSRHGLGVEFDALDPRDLTLKALYQPPINPAPPVDGAPPLVEEPAPKVKRRAGRPKKKAKAKAKSYPSKSIDGIESVAGGQSLAIGHFKDDAIVVEDCQLGPPFEASDLEKGVGIISSGGSDGAYSPSSSSDDE